jgi:hypothetical protein
MQEDIFIPIAGMLMIIVLALGIPLVRAHVRRMERGEDSGRGQLPEVSERLERIERAIDAMSIEVERISEGQRFVTKALADRSADRMPSPADLRRGSA